MGYSFSSGSTPTPKAPFAPTNAPIHTVYDRAMPPAPHAVRAGIVVPQGADGAPVGDATHPCTSWCSEQLAVYQLELASLRDQVAALRRDGRVKIEAVTSEPAAQPTVSGDGVVGARDRSPGTQSRLPLFPRASAAQAAASRSAERAAPLVYREDSKGTSGNRTQRALLQVGASSPALEGDGAIALPCDKNEVGDIMAAGDQERLAVIASLLLSNPMCAACVGLCADKPGFDPALCVYGCQHQMENVCDITTGWERARPLLGQVDLGSRDSLIRLMSVVLPPNVTLYVTT